MLEASLVWVLEWAELLLYGFTYHFSDTISNNYKSDSITYRSTNGKPNKHTK